LSSISGAPKASSAALTGLPFRAYYGWCLRRSVRIAHLSGRGRMITSLVA
jgi:hypothetical protein